MHNFKWNLLMASLLALTALGLAWPEESKTKEDEIPLGEAPERVRAAAVRAAGAADAVTEVERRTRDGITVYEIEFENATGEGSLTVAADGSAIGSEQEMTEDSLPTGIRTQLAKRFPGAKIDAVVRIVNTTYGIALDVNGKDVVVALSASGRDFGDDDDDDDDEDDDGEDDDDDGEDDD